MRSRYGWTDEYIESLDMERYLTMVHTAWDRHLEEGMNDLRLSAFTAYNTVRFMPFTGTEIIKAYPTFADFLALMGLGKEGAVPKSLAERTGETEKMQKPSTRRATTSQEEIKRAKAIEARVLAAFKDTHPPVPPGSELLSVVGEAPPKPPSSHKSVSLNQLRSLMGSN